MFLIWKYCFLVSKINVEAMVAGSLFLFLPPIPCIHQSIRPDVQWEPAAQDHPTLPQTMKLRLWLLVLCFFFFRQCHVYINQSDLMCSGNQQHNTILPYPKPQSCLIAIFTLAIVHAHRNPPIQIPQDIIQLVY